MEIDLLICKFLGGIKYTCTCIRLSIKTDPQRPLSIYKQLLKFLSLFVFQNTMTPDYYEANIAFIFFPQSAFTSIVAFSK